jgi:hypothetical protein
MDTAERITVEALGWMIASQDAPDAAESRPDIKSDDGLQRTLEMALRLHGGGPLANIEGVIPQIADLADAGHITVHGDSETRQPDAAAMSAKPSAYWLTPQDAQHVLASLCPAVRLYALTEAAECIAKRVHHDDYIAEHALKTSLTTDMRKAVERGELPENERRRDGEIMLNEHAVDEWLARERRPYRLGMTTQVRFEQRAMMRAGRLHIETVAARLAKKTGVDATRWESTLSDEIRAGRLPLKNPRNLADSLPYAVPKNLRVFYDRVDVVDVNKLLDAHSEWRTEYRFPNPASRFPNPTMPTESPVWAAEYNKGNEVDWDRVGKFHQMEARQAILWAHGLNPEVHDSGLVPPVRLHSNAQAADFFGTVRHLIELAKSERMHSGIADEWAAWMKAKGYPVHSKFAAPKPKKEAESGSVVTPKPDEQAEFVAAWWDDAVEASTAWGAESLTPQQAAMSLSGFKPFATSPEEAERVTHPGETTPEDYKRLLFVFESKERAEPKHRTLNDWLDIAREKGVKYHSWIDAWLVATGKIAPSVPTPSGKSVEASQRSAGAATDATQTAEGSVPRLAVGSNSRSTVQAYVAYQAKLLRTDSDTLKSLAEKVFATIMGGCRGERGAITTASITRMIPAGITGGLGRNGRKRNVN